MTPWRGEVDAAPTENTRKAYWEVAIPRLAAIEDPPPGLACVVVCHVTAPEPPGRAPAGPVGRAKGLLDALHEDRPSGRTYREQGLVPPLPNDDPETVAGLAVEVRSGQAHTEYLVGSELTVRGELLDSVPVEVAAPNDVWADEKEKALIAADRIVYEDAVRRAFESHPGLPGPAKALVIRHRPQRDEDNTWATWVAAICSRQRPPHWAAGAPLAGWLPTSIASVADSSLESPVAYELWA